MKFQNMFTKISLFTCSYNESLMFLPLRVQFISHNLIGGRTLWQPQPIKYDISDAMWFLKLVYSYWLMALECWSWKSSTIGKVQLPWGYHAVKKPKLVNVGRPHDRALDYMKRETCLTSMWLLQSPDISYPATLLL